MNFNSNWVFCDQFCSGVQGEIESPTSAEEWAYAGAFRCMSAEDGWNPITKFNRFTEGKAMIQKAVDLDQENVHVRFVRFVIQDQSPSFLDYKSNLNEDRTFLEEHLESWLRNAPKETKAKVEAVLKKTSYGK